MTAPTTATDTPPAEALRPRRETETLYAVITTVASSLRLDSVLDGIVEIATEATGAHACFVYFVEGERLILGAASPVYRELVGAVSMGIEEGLTGWVARTNRPEFIRENAMADPRMKYVPELEEERFQSMAAVPMCDRSGEVTGVIVLHTEAPGEFDEDVLNLLSHIASLVGGAVENAKLFETTRRQVDALTALARLSQRLAATTTPSDLHHAVNAGARELLGLRSCHTYRFDPEHDLLELAASDPRSSSRRHPAATVSDAAKLLYSLRENGGARGSEEASRALWGDESAEQALVCPLVVSDELVGLLCGVLDPAARPSAEDEALFRAVADQAAVGAKKLDLIERLETESTVNDLLGALHDGALEVARARAADVGVDLGSAHVYLSAERARSTETDWAVVAESVKAELHARVPNALIHSGHDRLRAIVPLPKRGAGSRIEALAAEASEIGTASDAIVGLSGVARSPEAASRALREAEDARRVGLALRPDGGALSYDELGAYRFLVHMDAETAPQDRHSAAVASLLEYDGARRGELTRTLEQFLADRGHPSATARALFIHPNTLRQRLARIEELTDLDLAAEDLLSLELAIKLARLRDGGH